MGGNVWTTVRPRSRSGTGDKPAMPPPGAIKWGSNGKFLDFCRRFLPSDMLARGISLKPV